MRVVVHHPHQHLAPYHSFSLSHSERCVVVLNISNFKLHLLLLKQATSKEPTVWPQETHTPVAFAKEVPLAPNPTPSLFSLLQTQPPLSLPCWLWLVCRFLTANVTDTWAPQTPELLGFLFKPSLLGVLVCLGCYGKIPWKLILLRFWRLEVQDESVGRSGFPEASLLHLQASAHSRCPHKVFSHEHTLVLSLPVLIKMGLEPYFIYP